MSAVITLAVTGCATIRGFPEPPTQTTVESPKAGWQLGPKAVEQYHQTTDATAKQLLRNEIIDARMADLDHKFSDYERAIYTEGIGSGVGTDWVLLGLTAGSTVSTVESTKTLLSALATTVVGGHASFDKRALFEKTLPALMAQMVAERETARAVIRSKQELPASVYTLSAAESDLKKFEFAGSIPGAITAVSQDAGQKAGTAKQALNEISAKYLKDAEGTLLRSFWKPDGHNVSSSNEALLRQWMSTNGLPTDAGYLSNFIRSADYASLRAKAVRDLGLNH